MKALLTISIILVSSQANAYEYREFEREEGFSTILGGNEAERSIHSVQQFIYSPNSLGTQAPSSSRSHSASQLSYDGPSGTFVVSYGPYHDGVVGDKLTAFFVYDDISMTASTYRTCHKRDWKGKCVGKTTHEHDHGFSIDLAADQGRKILASRTVKKPFGPKVFEYNGTYKSSDPLIVPLGTDPLNEIELRLFNPFGGNLNVKIKYVVIEVSRKRR